MRVIPVLDILDSQVVHGVKGERDKYAPIQSVLTTSTSPLGIAKAFKEYFPIQELYIADLDAIMRHTSTFSYLKEIKLETQLKIMLDAGIDEVDSAQKLLKLGVDKVIIGTETLKSFKNLQNLTKILDPKNLIVSVDLKKGKLQTEAKELQNRSPQNVISELYDLGIQEIIVLELTKVGSESGVMTDLLIDILKHTSISVITGGGARNSTDLQKLKNNGISGVLIATALHNGAITSQDLALL
jgi:phosphoribosylformimino-5-aminoimidazole carboxamide ribotide isomerase